MAQNRNLLQAMTNMLESQSRQIRVLVTKVNDLQEQVRTIQPQTYLHPIPKPRQGKEFSRSTSVAGWLFEAITELNQGIAEGNQKYLQFPEDIDFRRLNSDCIRELEGFMSFHIPDLCGKVTWEEVYSRRPKDCEKVIREARVLPELAVFAQAAGQWALRMLCANKMRTLMATNLKNSGKRKIRKVSNEPLVGEDDDCELQDDMEQVQADNHISPLTLQAIELSAGQDHEDFDGCHTENAAAGSEIEDATRCFESGEGSGESDDHSISDDFPTIQEMETTETQNVTTCQMSKDTRASESSSDTARNPCAAKVQVAAQTAARRALSPVADEPYRHKLVFDDLSHGDLPVVQNKVSLNNSKLAGGNKRNSISKNKGTRVTASQNRGNVGPRKVPNNSRRMDMKEIEKNQRQRLERHRSQNIRTQPSNSTKVPTRLNDVRTLPGLGVRTSSIVSSGVNKKKPSTIREKSPGRLTQPSQRSNEAIQKTSMRSRAVTKRVSTSSRKMKPHDSQAVRNKKVRVQSRKI